jgi:hypothetical protein
MNFGEAAFYHFGTEAAFLYSKKSGDILLEGGAQNGRSGCHRTRIMSQLSLQKDRLPPLP